MTLGAASAANVPDDTAAHSLAHWSEAGRAEMEAFYELATEDYRQLALAVDWRARLGSVARVDWRLLDVACGSGKFPTALTSYTDLGGLPEVAYDLLDPSTFSIAEARAALRPPFRAAAELAITLQELPADTEPYDVVWATHALYALPPAQLPGAAERFVSALRPGGLGLVAQATARSHYLAFYDAFRAGVRERTPYTSAEQVRDALEAAGARVRTQVITYSTGTTDRPVAEGFLQRCAFDDTTSLAQMEAAPGSRRLPRGLPGRNRRLLIRSRGDAAVAVNPLLPEANRGGALEQDWAGDDQQWWDWYVSLAANDAPMPLQAGPGLPDVTPASDDEVAAALGAAYELTAQDVEHFREQSFVKLPEVLPAGVVRRLADRLALLLTAEHGDDTAGRFTALEQMWRHDPLMREVALSPRLGSIAADLLGTDVRIYHDNALSKEPGCGRTPWHHDAEHFPLATLSAVTAWIPVSAIPAAMGPLSFAHGADLRPLLDGVVFDRAGTSYDEAVTARFTAAGIRVTDGPYAVGDVSFHGATCFHTAGRNGTTQPRRALATTYFADGARVVESPTMISGTWQEFLPGALPSGPAATEINPVVGRKS